MKYILKSRIVNNDAYDIAKANCLPEHSYLIWFYWYHNFRNVIRYKLNLEINKIKEESIVEALTK